MTFQDRADAGVRLAEALKRYRGHEVIVYALPRGGVVLGVEVAKSLRAPLELIVVRKIGHPDNPELTEFLEKWAPGHPFDPRQGMPSP